MKELLSSIQAIKSNNLNLISTGKEVIIYSESILTTLKKKLPEFKCALTKEVLEFLKLSTSDNIVVDKKNKIKINGKKYQAEFSVEPIDEMLLAKIKQHLQNQKEKNFKIDIDEFNFYSKILLKQDQILPDHNYCYFTGEYLIYLSTNYIAIKKMTTIPFGFHKSNVPFLENCTSIQTDGERIIKFISDNKTTYSGNITNNISKYCKKAIEIHDKYRKMRGSSIIVKINEGFGTAISLSDDNNTFKLSSDNNGKIYASCCKQGLFDFKTKIEIKSDLKNIAMMVPYDGFLKLLEVNKFITILPNENVIRSEIDGLYFYLAVNPINEE